MKLIYIAGPFRGATHWEIAKHCFYAQRASIAAWQHGWASFVPHMNWRNLTGVVPDEEIMRGCLEVLKRCDLMIALSGYQESKGTQQEIAFAEEHGIPCFFQDRGTPEEAVEEWFTIQRRASAGVSPWVAAGKTNPVGAIL